MSSIEETQPLLKLGGKSTHSVSFPYAHLDWSCSSALTIPKVEQNCPSFWSEIKHMCQEFENTSSRKRSKDFMQAKGLIAVSASILDAILELISVCKSLSISSPSSSSFSFPRPQTIRDSVYQAETQRLHEVSSCAMKRLDLSHEENRLVVCIMKTDGLFRDRDFLPSHELQNFAVALCYFMYDQFWNDPKRKSRKYIVKGYYQGTSLEELLAPHLQELKSILESIFHFYIFSCKLLISKYEMNEENESQVITLNYLKNHIESLRGKIDHLKV